MVIVIGDTEIVDAHRLREGEDLRDGVVGGFLAVPRVQVQLAFQPDAIGEARDGREGAELCGSPGIDVGVLGLGGEIKIEDKKGQETGRSYVYAWLPVCPVRR